MHEEAHEVPLSLAFDGFVYGRSISIVGALAMRAAMILAGVALIERLE